MDEAIRTIIVTASNWGRALQTVRATTSDPRHAQGTTILALTVDERRTLRNLLLTVLNEEGRRLRGEPGPSSDDDYELDAATPNDIDELSDEDEDDDYGENDIEEEELGVGGIVDYGAAYRDGGFGGVPASAAAIADRIKRDKYHEMEGRGDEEGGTRRMTAAARCMICIEDFEAGDDLGVMPCSHRFHQGCLVKWMACSRLCPCCRYALPSEAQTRS